MRYFIVIYPFLALISGQFLADHIGNFVKKKLRLSLIVVFLLFYPLSFATIYFRPHTRVAASRWIFENIPPKSVLACEHWDDCLPLSINNCNPGVYEYTQNLPLFDPDTSQKWRKLVKLLEKTDYIILSSNRLYGSIPRVPLKYPISAQYYESLFNACLGFKKIKEFSSYPCFIVHGLVKLCMMDDFADETFTVYDHPKVIILKNEKRLTQETMYKIILQNKIFDF